MPCSAPAERSNTIQVFVTGASGFIGSAVVRELIGAGHEVTGLARSDAAAAAVSQAGAVVVRGELADTGTLRRCADAADGVVHTAFIHDFSNFEASVQADKRAIEAMSEALAGSGRPLVVAGGLALVAPGRVVTENDVRDPANTFPRVSEETAMAAAECGVRASVMRLPPSVHGKGDHGFVPRLIALARDSGAAVYAGDGRNRWSAVHRLDAARLFRLALEAAPAGTKIHAVGDEGVPMREIAELIGRHLGVPAVGKPIDEAQRDLGWIGTFAALDAPASGELTRQRFGWQPNQPGLLEDLGEGHYFAGLAAPA
ncbi:MAG TPA: SDR family oxidoreductase [Candidatus Acidoferrales bacterium]|nr:SDR family oxidoreductase [Candidatus Acidoferrales bacterium]